MQFPGNIAIFLLLLHKPWLWPLRVPTTHKRQKSLIANHSSHGTRIITHHLPSLCSLHFIPPTTATSSQLRHQQTRHTVQPQRSDLVLLLPYQAGCCMHIHCCMFPSKVARSLPSSSICHHVSCWFEHISFWWQTEQINVHMWQGIMCHTHSLLP